VQSAQPVEVTTKSATICCIDLAVRSDSIPVQIISDIHLISDGDIALIAQKKTFLGLPTLLLSGLLSSVGAGQTSPQTEAFLTLPSCRNFVRHDDGRVLVGTNNGMNVIESDGSVHAFNLNEQPRDALIYDSEIIALAAYSIITIDQNQGKITGRFDTQSIKPVSNLLPQESPWAIGRVGHTLIIAHGTLGITLFDLRTRQLQNVIDINKGQKVKGMAQDVMTQNNDVYVLVDNYQMNPLKPSQEFRGLLKIDLNTRLIAARFSGLDPGATSASWFDETILISFGGMPVWKLQLPLTTTTPLANVAQLVTDFARKGHAVGHLSFDDDFVWSCHRPGLNTPNEPALYQRSTLRI